MSEKTKSKEEKIESAIEYINYAANSIESDFPEVSDELCWIATVLGEEMPGETV